MLSGLASTTKHAPLFIIQQGHNCVTGLNLISLRRSSLIGINPACEVEKVRRGA